MIQRNLLLSVLFPIAIMVFTNPGYSKSWSDRTFINGFMKAAYNISNSKYYFDGDFDNAGISHDGSFKNTEVGINIQSQVTEKIKFSTQILSRIEEDRYSMDLSWGYTSISLFNGLALRVGKVKFPVGLVNEYIGITFPWIQPPISVYADQINGPQATRESYTGISVFEEYAFGKWLFAADLFAGEVNLQQMNIKNLRGITLRLDWNDILLFQSSAYIGTMKQRFPDLWLPTPIDSNEMKMNNQDHRAALFGLKLNWAGIVLYAEWAEVMMDILMRTKTSGTIVNSDARNATAYYATAGYRFGNFLPHITYQKWENKAGVGDTLSSIGLNYLFSDFTVLKFEFSEITSNGLSILQKPDNDETTFILYKLAIDLVF